MSLATFSDLTSAIKSWSDRTDVSDALIADMITLADARIRKDLARNEIRTREMESRTDLSVSSGEATLPDDFMAMKAVQARESNPVILTYKPISWLNEAYPDGATATPSFYGIEGDTLYMFPRTTSDIRIVYFSYPEVLSSSNDDNWLLTKYPDIYLHAGLVELRVYEENDEAMQREISLLTAAFDGLDKSSFGAMYGTGTTRGASAYAT
jgi:hypothetical protein